LLRSPFDLVYGNRLTLGLARRMMPEIEILVVPEDVNLIMETIEEITIDGLTLVDALRACEQCHSRPLGSIVPRRKETGPLILAAIVYDFSHDPIAEISDVFIALVNAFEEANRQRAQAIAVKPLGTRPTAVASSEFWSVLTQVCRTTAELGTSVRRVDLLPDTEADFCAYDERLRASKLRQ
jgi:hypothetical protein